MSPPAFPAKRKEGAEMEGLLFLVFWFGCAILHTLYDLKVKHWFKSVLKRSA